MAEIPSTAAAGARFLGPQVPSRGDAPQWWLETRVDYGGPDVGNSRPVVFKRLGLSALAFVVLRDRPQSVLGLAVALTWVLLANQARLMMSLLAARFLDLDAPIWFHDWVGAVLTFLYTLGGLLIMVVFTMHMPERAEQDAAGRHTARRPDSSRRSNV